MPSDPSAPSRRAQAVRAAIDVLGTEGIRALTHGRVDERAGLPKGSTSNYFRTRAALFHGVVDGMLESELPAMDGAFAPRDVEELIDALTDLFAFFTGPNRVITAARLALFVEAAHDEDLRAALVRGRARIEDRLMPAFISLGAPDPAMATQAVAVCFEGMFLHEFGRHAQIDVRGLIGLVVRASVPAPTGAAGG